MSKTFTVKVLKMDSHKGKNTSSFFAASPKNAEEIYIGTANRPDVKVGEVLTVSNTTGEGDVLKFVPANAEQLKRYNSQKASGIDASLFD